MTKENMMKVPASVQHAALALAVALLTWGGASLNGLDWPLGVKALLAAVVTWALGYVTPLVTSYGVGATKAE